MTKKIKPQMSKEQEAIIGPAGEVAQAVMASAGTVLVGSSVFYKFVLNFLLGFVRSLSTMLHLLLIKVSFQGFMQSFFSVLMNYVKFDLFDTNPYYD
jgi:hypothetical protein